MSQDKETGYIDEVVCECIPCKRCQGEGAIMLRFPNGEESDIWDDCPVCKGTGKDCGDCAVHDAYPEIPSINATVAVPMALEVL